MIRSCLDIIRFQDFGQFFYFLTRQAVDDATLSLMLTDKHDNLFINIRRFLAYLIIKVGAIKRALKLSCIRNSQAALDICTNFIRSRSRQGNHRCIAYLVNRGTDISILWSKVVPPFRNAMRLINGIKRYFDRFEELDVFFLI